MCLKGLPTEFFRICLPPRGKCLRKELPLTEQNVSLSQLSTIRPKCREKTLAVCRTPCLIPSHDPRKERLCSLPVGTQRTMMMYLTYNHAKPRRQSGTDPTFDTLSPRHVQTGSGPGGHERARPNIPRPRSPTACPASGAPHLPILPGQQRNVHEPQEAHQEALQPRTQNVSVVRTLVGGKVLPRQVLQLPVPLKTTMTFITNPNTH